MECRRADRFVNVVILIETMFITRFLARFCRTREYVRQFSDLQHQVNQLELEVIEKREFLKNIKAVTDLPPALRLHRQMKRILNQRYEYQALEQIKENSKQLQEQYYQLKEDEEKKTQSIQKIKNQEVKKVQLLFLTDLARFYQDYEEAIKKCNLEASIKEGIELSHKSLGNLLEKQQVEWIGAPEEPYDFQLHNRVQGSPGVVNQVEKRGFKVRGQVIDKATVKTK